MANINENMARPWMPNSQMFKDIKYLYNDQLYNCNTEHVSGIEFDSSKFTKNVLTTLFAGVNSMSDYSNMTLIADAVTSDDDYTYLQLPVEGYVNTSTKVATLNINGCI